MKKDAVKSRQNYIHSSSLYLCCVFLLTISLLIGGMVQFSVKLLYKYI